MGKTYRNAGSKSPRTRSKASKLLDDPVASERALKEQLGASRLYAANITGDGNCLFRALSDQVYGDSKQHSEIRQLVCDYLAANAEQYSAFVETPFDEHVDSMRKNGVYGGNLELTAAAKTLNRFIKVIQPSLVYTISPLDESPAARAQRDKEAAARARRSDTSVLEPAVLDPLYLVYYAWEHYSSVRKLGGPHTGPPELGDIHFDGGTATNPPPPSADVTPDAAQSRKAARQSKRTTALKAAVAEAAATASASSDTDAGPSRPMRARASEREVLAALDTPHPPVAVVRDLLQQHHGDVRTVIDQLRSDPGIAAPTSSPDSEILTPTSMARKRAGSLASAQPGTRPRRARQITLEDASARAIEERGSSSPPSAGGTDSGEEEPDRDALSDEVDQMSGVEDDDEPEPSAAAKPVDDGPARHTRSAAALAQQATPPDPPPIPLGLSGREKREAQRIRKHQIRLARMGRTAPQRSSLSVESDTAPAFRELRI